MISISEVGVSAFRGAGLSMLGLVLCVCVLDPSGCTCAGFLGLEMREEWEGCRERSGYL